MNTLTQKQLLKLASHSLNVNIETLELLPHETILETVTTFTQKDIDPNPSPLAIFSDITELDELGLLTDEIKQKLEEFSLTLKTMLKNIKVPKKTLTLEEMNDKLKTGMTTEERENLLVDFLESTGKSYVLEGNTLMEPKTYPGYCGTLGLLKPITSSASDRWKRISVSIKVVIDEARIYYYMWNGSRIGFEDFKYEISKNPFLVKEVADGNLYELYGKYCAYAD